MCPHSDFDSMASISHIPTISENVAESNPNTSHVSLDEAMVLTGFGKFNIFLLLFVGTILLGMILETLGFSYIIPACQCDLELSLTQKGWLAAIPFIGIILTSHTWGYLADTRGRKKILVFSMAISCFCSILSSFSPDLITFAALRFISSIFISAPSSITYTYLGELCPIHYRDVLLTLGNSFIAIGIAVVPLLAWAFLPLNFRVHIVLLSYIYRPWRLLIAVFALPFGICSLLFIYFPESPKYLFNKGKTAEALEILKNIYKLNTGKPTENYPVMQLQNENDRKTELTKRSIIKDIWCQTVPLFKTPYLRYTITCCFLQFSTFSLVNGFYIWFPDVVNRILNDDSNLPTNICGILNRSNLPNTSHDNDTLQISTCDDSLNSKTFPITILLSCFVTIATVSSAFLLKRNIKKYILIVLFTISATCTLVIHWITNSLFAIIVFASLQVSGACIGIINAFVIEVFPTDYRAMAVCLTLMIGRVGSVFGTNIIGYLIHTMCPMSFILFTVLIYLSAALSFTLPRRPRESIKNSENHIPAIES